MYWFKNGRDLCYGSNMGEIYVLVQTWRDVCIGSNMGGMYVLIKTYVMRLFLLLRHGDYTPLIG